MARLCQDGFDKKQGGTNGSNFNAAISGGFGDRFGRDRPRYRYRVAGERCDAGYRAQPEAAGQIQVNMILGIAFAEAIAIYALVVALLLKFVA